MWIVVVQITRACWQGRFEVAFVPLWIIFGYRSWWHILVLVMFSGSVSRRWLFARAAIAKSVHLKPRYSGHENFQLAHGIGNSNEAFPRVSGNIARTCQIQNFHATHYKWDFMITCALDMLVKLRSCLPIDFDCRTFFKNIQSMRTALTVWFYQHFCNWNSIVCFNSGHVMRNVQLTPLELCVTCASFIRSKSQCGKMLMTSLIHDGLVLKHAMLFSDAMRVLNYSSRAWSDYVICWIGWVESMSNMLQMSQAPLVIRKCVFVWDTMA